ncbi:putative tRNA A64-2'-O-ribosylphosphate transferase, protein-tyrosine phosphatase, rit1 [Dioscorea sansibarensis]
MAEGEERLSIYRAARRIKRSDNSLYNSLRSIYEDSVFVSEIAALWPELPLVANLRCGLWYSSRFHSTCYFKSTDGHTNNWAFSTTRLNLHLARIAGQRGGCIIVDSTRKGKRFPDSMSKTIPIWACVLNRAIAKCLQERESRRECELDSETNPNKTTEIRSTFSNWDSSLHLPSWVPNNEEAAIGDRLEEWTGQLEGCGADIDSVVSVLKKPLRPLWISQKTLIWLNEVPECDSWDFTPLILISASAPNGTTQQRTTSVFSWQYIAGAGDDEESWARGLSPKFFWDHVFDLIDSGPDLCKSKVAEIVERERVYHAHRGEFSPQVTVKPQKLLASNSCASHKELLLTDFESSMNSLGVRSPSAESSLSWVGSTNIVVTSTLYAVSGHVDCVLNCDSKLSSFSFLPADMYMHLPIATSKFDRFSIINNLPAAISFAKSKLTQGNKLLICCENGEDISICVCLAILTYLFDEQGSFDGGKSFMHSTITKLEMRRRLVLICKFAANARPSRGNLKQVFAFLSKERDSVMSLASGYHQREEIL